MTYSVYLAGPMTNIPAFNFPLFFSAAQWLREQGIEVKSPAEKDLEEIPLDVMQTIPGYTTGDLSLYVANSSFTMANAMEWDLPAIQQSDGIALLPGWEASTGARWERIVAEALDRDVWLLTPTCYEIETRVCTAFTLDADPIKPRLTAFLREYALTKGVR